MTQSAHSDVDPEGKPESSCEKSVRLHGLLSRAQFQFGYGSYTRALISQTSDCGREIGDAKLNEKIESGMYNFDANEKGKGRKAICAELLRLFPSYARRRRVEPCMWTAGQVNPSDGYSWRMPRHSTRRAARSCLPLREAET